MSSVRGDGGDGRWRGGGSVHVPQVRVRAEESRSWRSVRCGLGIRPVEEGDSFGEIALLHDAERRAHAYALTECRLMLLMKSDFHGLMETEPTLRQEIAAVAAERLAKGEWSQGDISDEELQNKPREGE